MFRLAHFSDPHLPPPPGAAKAFTGSFTEVFSKRTLSRLAWRRKQRQHNPAVLAALVADIKAYAPDHIALTGDLTNFSAPAEFVAARDWLATLGASAAVTVSPGNHDALVVEGLAQRFAMLAPWFGDGAEPAFPHVRRREGVAIVNLCTAFPTPPLLAAGLLGADQLSTLEQILSDLKREGLFRLILLHHPPLAGVVSRRKALLDAEPLRAVLARCGAELILHGHGHETAFGGAPGPHGPVPVLGVPSASMPQDQHHAPARWNAIEIAQDQSVTIIARGLGPNGDFDELGRFVLPPLSSNNAA